MKQSIDNQTHNFRGGYVEWIDVAKVLTLVLVILGHATYYKISSSYGNYEAFENMPNFSITHQILCYITSFIYSFHMPFFMCLSGMCLAISLKPHTNLKIFIKKKAYRLLIPFLFVTIFITVPCKYFSGYYDRSIYILKDIFLGQFFLMGNSHLWFIVSLFVISISFLFLYNRNWHKGLIFYIISFITCFIGQRLHGGITDFCGIPGAMNFFIYFALGFNLYEFIKKFNVKSYNIVLSWILMISLFLVFNVILQWKYISYFMTPFIALWGCYNMILTSKLIEKFIVKHKFYQSLKQNSYDLYLYSDPFNYVIIAILVPLLGENIISSNLDSFLVYVIRIFGTTFIAYLIIYLFARIIKPFIIRTKEMYPSFKNK